MAHANARLTPAGRLILVGRIAAQPRRPIAHIAHEMGISRTTAYRWWSRYQQLGEAGLVDRPSIPATAPGGPPPGWSSASQVAAARAARPSPHRCPPATPGLRRPPGPGTPWLQSAEVAGPPHRPADPSLEHLRRWKTGPTAAGGRAY
jgi:transposase-like protein